MTTVPTKIVDKNGKQTTVHKKVEDGAATARNLPAVTPRDPGSLDDMLSARRTSFAVVGLDADSPEFNEVMTKFQNHLYSNYGRHSFGEDTAKAVNDALFAPYRTSSYGNIEMQYAEIASLLESTAGDTSEPVKFPLEDKLSPSLAVAAIDRAATAGNVTATGAIPEDLQKELDQKFTNYLVEYDSFGLGGDTASAIADYVWEKQEDEGLTYFDMAKRYTEIAGLARTFKANEG
jgi:hypothetical protein